MQPTYREDSMVEGIDLDSNFYWLAHEPDATSLQVLDRRRLHDRLIVCSPDDEPEVFARVQCQLGGLAEKGPRSGAGHMRSMVSINGSAVGAPLVTLIESWKQARITARFLINRVAAGVG